MTFLKLHSNEPFRCMQVFLCRAEGTNLAAEVWRGVRFDSGGEHGVAITAARESADIKTINTRAFRDKKVLQPSNFTSLKSAAHYQSSHLHAYGLWETKRQAVPYALLIKFTAM